MSPCPNITPCDEDAAILSDINAESGDTGAETSCAVASTNDEDAAILSDLSAEHADPAAAVACPNFTPCDDTVLGNLTVESPDVPVEFVYDFTKPDPPLDSNSTPTIPSNPNGLPGTPTPGGEGPTPTPPPHHSYRSEAVQWGITCPDGFDIIFSLAPGAVTSSTSQTDANTRALKIAKQYAEANELTWILPSFACVGTNVASNLTIINALMPGQSVVWTHDSPPAGTQFVAIADRTAQLTGAPSAAGVTDWAIMAMDSKGNTVAKTFRMTTELMDFDPPYPLEYYPGEAYAGLVLTVSGNIGVPRFTWDLDAEWGLALNPETGVITGTPPSWVIDSLLVNVAAVDQTTGCSASGSLMLRRRALPPFTLTATAPDYTVGTAYGFTVSTTLPGGAVVYSSTNLPAWLHITNDIAGTLAGTPPDGTAGKLSFTIRARELAGAQRTIDIPISIYPVFNWITTQAVFDDPANNYRMGGSLVATFQTTAAGVTFSYTNLPFWITAYTADGVISGVVADVGVKKVADHCTVRVTAYAPDGRTKYQEFTLYEFFDWVSETDIADFYRNSTYSVQLATTLAHPVEDGAVFSRTSGTLPDFASMDANGLITGAVPNAPNANTYSFTVQVALTGRTPISRTFTTIQALQFTTTALPIPTEPAYIYQITMTGARGALTFTAPLGLPPGMSLSSGGRITGLSPAIASFWCHVAEVGGRIVDNTFLTATPLGALGWNTAADGGLDRYTPDAAYSFPVSAYPVGVVFSMVTDPTGWLAISSGGVLSGTVPADVADTITGLVLRITDIYGRTADRTFSMTMADIADLVLTTTQGQIPTFTDGASQLVTFFQTGAIGTPSWTVTSDTLGVAAGSNPGQFHLTPDDTLDDYLFHVELSDERGRTVNEDFHLWRALAWPAQTVTPMVKGVLYSFQIETTWSHTPPTIYETPGTLPPGLSMSSHGLVTGTPTGTDASYSVPVTAEAGNQTITTTLTFPSLNFAFTTTTVPDFNPYAAFDPTFKFATSIPHDANGPRFSAAAGDMPPGFNLNLDGSISGGPSSEAQTNALSYAVRVTATYSYNGTDYAITQTFTMRRAILFRTEQAYFDGTSAGPNHFFTPATGFSATIDTTLIADTQVHFSVTALSGWTSWTISNSGVLSGTPPAQTSTSPTSYTFTVTAIEQGGTHRQVTKDYVIYQQIEFIDAGGAVMTKEQQTAYLTGYYPALKSWTDVATTNENWVRTVKVRGVQPGHIVIGLQLTPSPFTPTIPTEVVTWDNNFASLQLTGVCQSISPPVNFTFDITITDNRHSAYSFQFAGMKIISNFITGPRDIPFSTLWQPGQNISYHLTMVGSQDNSKITYTFAQSVPWFSASGSGAVITFAGTYPGAYVPYYITITATDSSVTPARVVTWNETWYPF